MGIRFKTVFRVVCAPEPKCVGLPWGSWLKTALSTDLTSGQSVPPSPGAKLLRSRSLTTSSLCLQSALDCTGAQFRHRRCAAVGALLVCLHHRSWIYHPPRVLLLSFLTPLHIILFGPVGCVTNWEWLQSNFPFLSKRSSLYINKCVQYCCYFWDTELFNNLSRIKTGIEDSWKHAIICVILSVWRVQS